MKNKIYRIIKILEENYGIPEWSGFSEPLDELIFTILSQNTNDKNRDRAFSELKKTFPDHKSILNSSQKKLERTIRTAGLAEQKSKNIKGILKKLKKENGKLSLKFLKNYDKENARNYLLSLTGVGPKTAACVLLFSLKMPAFPVDTHIFRVTKRLGLIPEKTGIEWAHRILEGIVPEEKYHSFHINLIRHGRKLCHPSKPECNLCPVRTLCNFYLNPHLLRNPHSRESKNIVHI
jgi:endonuclease-3